MVFYNTNLYYSVINCICLRNRSTHVFLTLLLVEAAQAAAFKNGRGPGGRPPHPLDLVIEAVFFRLRNSGPWRDLPTEFGPWQAIYGYYRLWAREGLWARMLRRVAKRKGSRGRLVDGTLIVAHQCAANPRGGAEAQAVGKTRGGRNTKLMAVTDVKGRPLNMKLIPGQAYEGAHVIELLKDEDAAVLLIGDKGFDSDKLRAALEALGHRHRIPGKSNRKKKVRYSKRYYRIRYRVEDSFRRLKRWACACTRRDKLALHFMSLPQFAAVTDWMQ
ncbi:MAG TPA: IS5 family transposase [Verrucomicrobiales bacterium]|nr:IS5 family transposase [Verrucomicrobiales bacterium]